MVVVGLTGGIGSGKSTVARLLRGYGAVVIDADQVVREAQAPGGAAYAGIVARFGPAVVGVGGALDRAALAKVVFADAAARSDLEALTHPAVKAEVMGRLAALAGAGAGSTLVVVLEIPLLAEAGRGYPLDGILVVDCPPEVAVARLAQGRGMAEADARARIAAQVPPEERLAIADVVIDNSGDLGHLRGEVDRAWAWIERLAGGPTPSP
ncbi:MAG: dephospho-CoA kinase [Acidimicrobiales bacterium]